MDLERVYTTCQGYILISANKGQRLRFRSKYTRNFGHYIDQVILPVGLENASITPTCSKPRNRAALPKLAVYVNLESM